MKPRLNRYLSTAALSATLLTPFAAAQATLLVNGSFETGDFTGWTVAGAADVQTGAPVTDGSFAAKFNGSNVVGSMVLSQTVATTPGSLYRLQFDHGVNGAQTQPLGVNVSGAGTLLSTSVSDTGTNPPTFLRHYFDFIANSASTTVTFTDNASVAQSASTDGNLDFVILDLTPAVVLSPGGAGTAGIVNYVSGNVALASGGAVATQTSTSSSGVASRGNDGNTNGTYSSGSVTHTAAGVGESWRVDLTDEFALSSINVFNRTDSCCGARLMEFNIDVINDEIGTVSLNPFDFGTPADGAGGVPGPGLQFNLAPNTIADAVRIVQNAAFPLSLAEVQAIGLPNLSMNPIDTLEMDLGAAGLSDFFNVEGDANLQGILSLNAIGGYIPANETFVLLSAASINLGSMEITHAFGPGILTSLEIVSGGNGQQLLLHVQYIPEPATLSLGLLGLITLASRRRRPA